MTFFRETVAMFSDVSERASAYTHLEDAELSREFIVTGLHTVTPHAKAGLHPFLSVCRTILWSDAKLMISVRAITQSSTMIQHFDAKVNEYEKRSMPYLFWSSAYCPPFSQRYMQSKHLT